MSIKKYGLQTSGQTNFCFYISNLKIFSNIICTGRHERAHPGSWGDYGLLRLRIIYYDSAWPRTVNTKGAGGKEKLPAGFCQTSHPYKARGADYAHYITTPPPGFSYLPTALWPSQ